ncbi:putative membrane protein YgcG [Mucilaginibacter yixingensis]|uniref:Putative membrane protein YgcG n=1 Tax=Mucilaginibacter yixingensis TaxID=1295612 RepID=A0A2T5JB10_9SPHI|nr:TPM domain-containing protein [Mucilaginibacter yixingensis]PTQ98056.1 putative membrane protein YgcG [Mucilaginibacter yixingensis]
MKKFFLLFYLLFSSVAFAQIPQPQKNTYVNDFAGVLTKSQVTELNKKIFELEKTRNVQLAIVLVNKIPVVYDIQDFAVLIGKKWHVGKNKRGIVYVAAIKQRKQRIEVASNLENVLSGDKCLSILADLKPSFKTADYNAGLQTLVTDLGNELPAVVNTPAQQATQATTVGPNNLKKDDDETLKQIIGAVVVFAPILLIILYIRNQRRKRLAYRNAMGVNDPNYFIPGQGTPGYNNDPYNGPTNGGYYGQPQSRRNWGGILGGAAAGAAAGYAGRALQDRLSGHHHSTPSDTYQQPNNSYVDNSASNEPSNWGSWGDNGGSSDDNSSYDSGFSDDSSSDSGASSDW